MTDDIPRSRIARAAAEAALVRVVHHYGERPEFVILGGLVPELLCSTSPYSHAGTTDVDVQHRHTRIYEHLHHARPLLLNLGPTTPLDIGPHFAHIPQIDATHTGRWELPVLGEFEPLSVLLIRPDGYVAWAGTGTDTGSTPL